MPFLVALEASRVEVASLVAGARGDAVVAPLLEAWVPQVFALLQLELGQKAGVPRSRSNLCLEASLLVLSPLSFRPRGICLSSLTSLQSEPKHASLQYV